MQTGSKTGLQTGFETVRGVTAQLFCFVLFWVLIILDLFVMFGHFHFGVFFDSIFEFVFNLFPRHPPPPSPACLVKHGGWCTGTNKKQN